MTKNRKLLLSLGALSLAAMPLMAISCNNAERILDEDGVLSSQNKDEIKAVEKAVTTFTGHKYVEDDTRTKDVDESKYVFGAKNSLLSSEWHDNATENDLATSLVAFESVPVMASLTAFATPEEFKTAMETLKIKNLNVTRAGVENTTTTEAAGEEKDYYIKPVSPFTFSLENVIGQYQIEEVVKLKDNVAVRTELVLTVKFTSSVHAKINATLKYILARPE